MRRVDMQAFKRESVGKGAARSARREGRIPAVVYGGDREPQPISVDAHLMRKALHAGGESENILVNLGFENESNTTLVLVRDAQHNPLSGQVEHLDFYRVSLDRPLTTTIPIHSTGTAVGLKNGGIFEQILREVEIECLPLNIPDFLEVDISGLDVGQSLHVSDLPISDKYRIITAAERSVATVTTPQVEAPKKGPEAAEVAPAGAAAAS